MKYRLIIFVILVLFVVASSIFNFYKKPEVLVPNTPNLETNTPLPSQEKEILLPQEGLPPLVEAKRQAIYTAAISRDYEKLNAEISKNFYYSFGGEYEGGFVGYLKLSEKDEGKSAFDIIPTILRLPYAHGDDLYTWPSVFSIEPSKWTSEDIAMMKTFLTDEEIQSYRDFGGYIYYRIGIKSTGEWVFYLAGD